MLRAAVGRCPDTGLALLILIGPDAALIPQSSSADLVAERVEEGIALTGEGGLSLIVDRQAELDLRTASEVLFASTGDLGVAVSRVRARIRWA